MPGVRSHHGCHGVGPRSRTDGLARKSDSESTITRNSPSSREGRRFRRIRASCWAMAPGLRDAQTRRPHARGRPCALAVRSSHGHQRPVGRALRAVSTAGVSVPRRVTHHLNVPIERGDRGDGAEEDETSCDARSRGKSPATFAAARSGHFARETCGACENDHAVTRLGPAPSTAAFVRVGAGGMARRVPDRLGMGARKIGA